MNELLCYRDRALEDPFRERLHALARRPHAAASFQDRLLGETDLVFRSGRGTLFALVEQLVEFSLDQGYPVSFRGGAGNLLLSHVMGLAQNDPAEFGIPRQAAFGAHGDAVPHLTLNVAHAIYPDLMACLWSLVPDCPILQGAPGQPRYRVTLAPGSFDPDRRYLTLDILCHQLMDAAGEAVRGADCIPSKEEIFSPGFLRQVWEEADWNDPILQDMLLFKGFAPHLVPEDLDDFIRLLGLSLVPDLWVQAASPSRPLSAMIATREDLYGRPAEESPVPLQQLYPRAQCAEYLTYALVLVWYRLRG